MTITQKQCLLAYLGYYVGNIDGKWGTLSEVATKAFQKDFGGVAVDGKCGPETENALKHAVAYGFLKKEDTATDYWSDIRYFKRAEFGCKCGKCGGFPVEPNKDLVKILDKIREHFGRPVTVSSGVRCATHNKIVGGVSNSQHTKGTAADIIVDGVAPAKVADYAETLLPNTGGIGRYATFTHIDVRTTKSRWNG